MREIRLPAWQAAADSPPAICQTLRLFLGGVQAPRLMSTKDSRPPAVAQK